jgi:hypothetical protein
MTVAAPLLSRKTLVSFTDLPKMQTLTPLKSHKTDVFETSLSAYQTCRESHIQGRVLNGLEKNTKAAETHAAFG